MPLAFGADIVEGKVYRSKKKQDDNSEESALKELQSILSKKNRVPCDCGAQLHDLVANCLTCGRLTCESEGPGKCISCGSIILNDQQRSKLSKYIEVDQAPISSTSSNRPATGSKSRIIDNQFDHFAIDNKKHLKESEKKMLKETLEQLQAKRYQRKMVFAVDVDNLEAGSRSAPMIDDYEAELRLLQLSDNSGATESNLSLSDLVSLELKRKYNFEYVENTVASKRQHNQQKKEKPTTSTATSYQPLDQNLRQGYDRMPSNSSQIKFPKHNHKQQGPGRSKKFQQNDHGSRSTSSKSKRSAWDRGNTENRRT